MSEQPPNPAIPGVLTTGVTVGNYRIESKIGEGGMGAVYVAEHPLLGRKAAVKVLLPEHSKRGDLVTRFFNEAKTAAGLRHPALVEVFDFGFLSDGSGYIVMDYLEGESLAARLTRVAPLAPEDAAEIARQIAGGVGAAHGHGIVHRDLKPDNIFLVADPENPARERVKILDFGIAKLVVPEAPGSKGATSTGMILGTPLFMAPEQCRGTGQVDHRADIYSLGCLLYMMLAARPPFPYEGVGEILGAHLHEPVTGLRTLDPGIPETLEAITLKALEKKPEARYQTMGELAADLQRFLASAAPAAVVSLAHSPSFALRETSRPRPVAISSTRAPTTSTSAHRGTATPAEEDLPVDRPIRRHLPAALIGVATIAAATLGVTMLGRKPPAETAGEAMAEPATKQAPAPTTAIAPPAEPDAASLATDSESPAPKAHANAASASKRPDRRERTSRFYDQGLAHRKRGEEAEALLAFRAYLRGERLPPDERANAERQVIALQRKFGEINVSCDLDGAEVAVDGRSYGRTPLRNPILVRPGRHTVSLTRAGYNPVSHTLTVGAGERVPMRFKLPR